MSVWTNRILTVLCAVGLFIAGVLSYTTWKGLELPCGNTMSCVEVQSSQWSTLGPIHVAYIGLVGYILIFALAVARSLAVERWKLLSVAGLAFSAIGLGYSFFLTFVSFTVIHATCIWCLSSFATMILLTIAHAALFQADPPANPDRTIGLPLTGAAVLIALGAGALVVHNRQSELDKSVLFVNAQNVSLADALPEPAKIQGSAEAPVTVVEFADMNCPLCRSMFPKVEALYSDFGGKLRIAYRNFPLIGVAGHETSANAALIGELAAEKGKFWKYLHTIMDPDNTQRIKSPDGLVATAVDAGLDRTEIVNLFHPLDDKMKQHSEDLLKKVSEDIDSAMAYRIGTTPTFIIYAKGLAPKPVSANRLELTLRNSPYIDLLRG